MRELLGGDERGGLRALAGLLFGVGMLLVIFRRTSFPEPWDDGVVFGCFLVPCALLYSAGVLGGRAMDGRATSWQSVYAVFGIIFVPLTLFEFLEWLGGEASAFNSAWIFLLTAVAAFAATLIGQVRAGALLGGLALIVSWIALWDGVLDDGVSADVGTLRGLLVIAAVLLLLGVAILSMGIGVPERAPGDLGTAAVVAAVAAGAISLAAVPEGILFFFFGIDQLGVGTSAFWDGYLLVVSLAAVLFGATSGIRGPTYVGAFGLVAFILVVGFDSGDSSPEGSLLGWPLILLVLGIAAFAWSARPALRRADS